MSDKQTMKYCRLGQSGLKISKISTILIPLELTLVLGCMSYGHPSWAGWVLDEDKSLPLLKAAWDAGIQTWDTADIYSNVLSHFPTVDTRVSLKFSLQKQSRNTTSPEKNWLSSPNVSEQSMMIHTVVSPVSHQLPQRNTLINKVPSPQSSLTKRIE